MRLNRVELFYALVAVIGSESRRYLQGRGGHMHAVCMQRWLATARPPIGAADHGLATCKEWPTAAKAPLQGAAARRGSSPHGATTRGHGRLRPARKGLPPTDSPATSRGDGAGYKGGRPFACAGAVMSAAKNSVGEGGLWHLFREKYGYAP
ncbi:hypothetical protein GW17_00060818 [Ensete ventricosum]|nr:hypothetical protein GW17_00060818 [Ensete ventricosum]